MTYTGPERRRIGRPPVGERVNVRLPDDLYDLACRIALRRGISVSAVIRIAFARYASSVAVNPSTEPPASTL